MECAVSIYINATPDAIWTLLTTAQNFPQWNSTVLHIDGRIALGETIKLKAAIDPKRIFKLKVSEFVPYTKMVWRDGFASMFQGVRTYTLKAQPSGDTLFSMAEVFSGIMLPMIAGSLPDFKPVFEQYARDVKAAAEQSYSGNYHT